jgi:hypothetical protein
VRSRRGVSLIVVIAVGAALAGCSRRATQTSGGGAGGVPLPEWAPQNPSPEFLRTAKVIKPNPPELGQESAQGELAQQALNERYERTLPAAWELFGTLRDDQIKRFLSAKALRIPVRDLSDKQRAALEHFFSDWRTAMKGAPPDEQDWLRQLYKFGAREDLSNVDLAFDVRGSGIVRMMLVVRRQDGGPSPLLPLGLGHI